MARIDVMTERPIGLVDPGIFGGFAGACAEGDLWAAVRDLGATSMRWASRPDKPWCGEAEPVLCLDMTGSTLDDALAWAEYCSGTYGVRYWGLGREMYDGRRTAAEYVAQARRWARALRRLDPGLRLISCGRTGLDDWDRDVIDGLASQVDLHGIHFCTGSVNRDPRRAHPTRVALHEARATGVMTVHEVTGTDVVTVRAAKHEVSAEHVDVTFAPRSFTLLELPLA